MEPFDKLKTFSAMDIVARPASRRAKWTTMAVAVAVSAIALFAVGTATVSTSPTAGLPAAAESTRVVDLQQTLPSSQVEPVFVVVKAGMGQLTDAARTVSSS